MRTLFTLLLTLGAAHAQEAPPAEAAPPADAEAEAEAPVVILQLEGLKSTEGRIYVAVFDQEKGFPGDSERAVWRGIADVVVPTTKVEIRGLVPGPHAVVVFHDENDNGELDTRAVIPIPKEPMGVSRDASRPMGPPRFDDARFDVVPGTTTQVIHVERIGPG